MTFPSLIYGLFLISLVGIFWSLPYRQLRLWILLAASLVFYGSIQPAYVPLLLAMTLVNYWLGEALALPMDWRISNREWEAAELDWSNRRRGLMIVGVSLNIVLLFGFKYVPFVLDTLGLATQPADWLRDSLIVPLGISYFCFESIAYLVDVYRGAPPAGRFGEFAAYKLFFPKLTAGPITRYHAVEAQFKTLDFPRLETATDGLWLIAIGAMKKLLIADHLAILVNLSFDNLARAGSGDIWLATFAYGLQLYFDFSGYVDMARGSALLLGIKLPANFNFPYMTTSIADFWRRWHMTLGDWLRNYLYFPLGGSRLGLGRTCLNFVIVMTLGGIWHGAAWGFVIWGLLHGVALAVHRWQAKLTADVPAIAAFWQQPWGVVLAWALTQLMVRAAWLFFRLPNWDDFSLAVSHLWGHTADIQFAQKVYWEALGFTRSQLTLWLSSLVGLMAIVYGTQQTLKLKLNWPTKLLVIPLCLFLAWVLSPSETIHYIYFEF